MGNVEQVTAGQERRRPVLDSYGRLSRVPHTGELEKIETQWADNRKVIKRLRGVLGEELSDGLSAWKKGVRRKGWERLLERVQSGESDGIVVWHTDRLFRQPRDLETLIDLAEKGFQVASAHGERRLDDPDDRFILRIEVAHAARSSDDSSRRIKRRWQTKREQGVAHPGGRRRFGWPGADLTWTPGPDEGEEDRPVVSDAVVQQECQALRDGTDANLAGVGLDTIAAEWNERGVRAADGREWVAPTVRRVLLRATNAGLIEHEGVLVARIPGEPIVDLDRFERLRAKFAARSRGRVVGERYVGTGILRCGSSECGITLSARPQESNYRGSDERRATYFCNKQRRGCGKIYADKRAVDRELRAFTIARLSDFRHAAAIAAARSQVRERLDAVLREIAECEKIQNALSERLGRRKMTLDAFDKANEPLARDLAKLTAERDALSGGNLDGPTQAQPPEAIAAQWDAAEIAERRAMLTQALGRHQLRVLPYAGGGKRVFDRNRLRLINPDGTPVTLDTAD